ncbi:hypothetical protein [Pleomorphomonas koreensis]|uniref:hypothetical protein n=1 Tax=Pleomorphomonas koreensis TaxID=257440 RepID=UPI0003F75451|nr:hypothetical protein [Pleomorphomonas koreensis]
MGEFLKRAFRLEVDPDHVGYVRIGAGWLLLVCLAVFIAGYRTAVEFGGALACR